MCGFDIFGVGLQVECTNIDYLLYTLNMQYVWYLIVDDSTYLIIIARDSNVQRVWYIFDYALY